MKAILSKYVLFLFLLAAGFLTLAAGVCYHAARVLQENQRRVTETYEVLGRMEALKGEMWLAERDERNYVITEQGTWLAGYDEARDEAAEILELPDALGRKWYNRGYHGTLHHNVRAVYHKELGMWDGDPVSLNPLPATESGRRFVELIGTEAILAEGRRAIASGDYRWAVEILHKLVFAEPDNAAARELQADAYEQLGYQAEGPQWRGVFLTMARELRDGIVKQDFTTVAGDVVMAMPPGANTPSMYLWWAGGVAWKLLAVSYFVPDRDCATANASAMCSACIAMRGPSNLCLASTTLFVSPA